MDESSIGQALRDIHERIEATLMLLAVRGLTETEIAEAQKRLGYPGFDGARAALDYASHAVRELERLRKAEESPNRASESQ